MRKGFTLVHLLMVLALLGLMLSFVFGCARVEQEIKYAQGGLTDIPRTIELYSYDGKKIKEYSGTQTTLDYRENYVNILIDGKFITASNVIIVTEGN